MKITKHQQKEIEKLEKWFTAELARLKKKEIDIMKRYDEKKTLLIRQHISKKIVAD